MNSTELFQKLIKEGHTQAEVRKITGYDQAMASKIANGKYGKMFSADALSALVYSGLITAEEALKVRFYDSLMDKKKYKYVASVALAAGLTLASGTSQAFNISKITSAANSEYTLCEPKDRLR